MLARIRFVVVDMSAFSELLAQHAPYVSKRRDNTVCLRCLDDSSHGEFVTTDAWAAHVETELAAAGLAVTRRRPATPAEQLGLM